ncbi:MAG TPA: DUF3048 domain-containing protein [Candidatus Saccharimonadales bacterium]|jgi:hypothetical protein
MLKKLLNKLKKNYHDHQAIWRYILIGLTVVLVAWLGWIWWSIDQAVQRSQLDSKSSSEPAVKFVASPLTGINVSEELAKRPVIAVQVENSPEARPQSGLEDAGVIFEAIAEAGITRFSVYYQEAKFDKIGPIRSLRPYYIDWAKGFDASILNTGTSVQARQLISKVGIRDLNVGGAWYRASDRFAPHNAYASYDDVAKIMKDRGWYDEPDFTPLLRKDASPLETPTASSISVDISSALYNISYAYSPGCNCYRRSQAGNPHKERESGQQLSPDVVVVLKTPHSVISGVGHLGIDTIGSGTAFIFQDGGVQKVTWKKSSRAAQIKFTDSDGEAVGLNPGQTWFTVVNTDRPVTYKP